MATHLNPPFKQRAHSFLSRPMQFQRREGEVKTKKVQRRLRVKIIHILLFFTILGGIFFSIQRVYLFLISWDYLSIKNITVVSGKPEIREEVYQFLRGKRLGNILLLNIGKLQETFAAQRWIKEVRVRKIFPSTLCVEIKERIPFAVLEKENLYLIDREGIQLEKLESAGTMNLPLLVDSNNFQKDFKEKIELAWECLNSLPPLEKDQLEVLDFSDYENVTVQLKAQPIKLKLGNSQFSQKLKLFEKYRLKLEEFGEVEYADLRFPGRIIFLPKSYSGRNFIPNADKEAH